VLQGERRTFCEKMLRSIICFFLGFDFQGEKCRFTLLYEYTTVMSLFIYRDRHNNSYYGFALVSGIILW
jgi:hypothetical protein